MSASELSAMLERHEPVTVLDVRPAVERAEWSIPGSIHRDAYHALRAGEPSALDDLALPLDRPVVTVCARGYTSEIAAAQLRSRGIHAVSLRGGMKAWSLAWNTAEISAPDANLIQFRRTGKGCLSYLVTSRSDAVVMDPSLDPEVYVHVAEERGWTIRAVLETHIHADHLSRARALCERTGATIMLPEQRRVAFPYQSVREGTQHTLGSIALSALHTPGHTLESTCYVVDGRWLITGDTLFLSAVGRPDLEADAEQARARALLLHSSLRRLFELAPDLLVLPAHTSQPIAFDRTMVTAPLATVRDAVHLPERAEAFADYILGRIPPAPPNHGTIVALNEAGEMPAGDATELEAGANRCAVS